MPVELNPAHMAIAITLCLAILCFPIICRPTEGLLQIPTMGHTGYLPAIYNSISFQFRGQMMLNEAFLRFGKTGIYKMQFFNGWNVFVLNKKYIADLRSAKDRDVSFFDAHKDLMALEYTTGAVAEEHDDLHLRELVRMLNINILNDGKDLYEESIQAIKEIFPIKHSGWHSIVCYENILYLAARVSNRAYVGEPLCRNPKYIDLLSQYIKDVPKIGMIINMFPESFKPFIGPLISPLSRYKEVAMSIFGDQLKDRIKIFEQHGENCELNPRDIITSFLEEKVKVHQPDSASIIMRLLRVNFAGLALISFFLPQILYRLAISPEYIEPLREHISSLVDQFGWTKEGIRRMYKLDSFIREVSRLQGFDALGIHRKVTNPEGFTFHDGLNIPKGTHVQAFLDFHNHNEDMFEDPATFDGMRFARVQEEADEVSMKEQITSPAIDNLYFGAGKHTCPGRFLAMFIIKIQVALILDNFDIKIKDNVLPRDIWMGSVRMPNTRAEFMYKRRYV